VSAPPPAAPPVLDDDGFVCRETALVSLPFLPELRLHLATEITPLWQTTEDRLASRGLAPPYWAFAWAGGQALARYLLDRPAVARGKRVLDFAAGCGVAGIAAARAGAASVAASELDALAGSALALNAAANGVALDILMADLTLADLTLADLTLADLTLADRARAEPGRWDLVLAGDVCYERPMAERAVAWLRRCVAEGADVLLGDPGRAYLPKEGLVELARYEVPTSRELEDRDSRATVIYRLGAA